jgi:hypothetical protein
VLETLKASGDALKHLGATGQGLRAVEDIVADVEGNLQHAAEITSILSSGSVSGLVNNMAIHGIVVDDDDLMRELDCLLDEDEEKVQGLDSAFPVASITGRSSLQDVLKQESISSSDKSAKRKQRVVNMYPSSDNNIYEREAGIMLPSV